MPNPFPGMNPYLEDPSQWRAVHTSLVYCFGAALNAVLAAPFAARLEERVYVQGEDRNYVADALAIEKMPEPQAANGAYKNGGSGTTTAVRVAQSPVLTKTLTTFDAPLHLEFGETAEHERYIEIRSGRSHEDVVAVVEFLSPKNKRTGIGRSEYKRKQEDVLDSGAHLLEIDLLRAGPRAFYPPENELRQRLGHFDYLISLHYAQDGIEFDFWPVAVRDRLPRLRLPLTGNESVVVDLQAVLERVYNEGSYDALLDYTKPPVPPLSPDDAEWASERIAKMNAASAENQAGTIETKEF